MYTISSIPSANIPHHKLGLAMLALQATGKRPCFRIKGLRITIATPHSKNPGYLYIRNEGWDYIGKISPAGYLNIMHPSMLSAEQKVLIHTAITDPESVAMSDGKVTGTCCCCGRKLTNKLSIELGIGPICRGYWFPEPTPSELPELHSVVPELVGTLDIGLTPEEQKPLTDTLDLDLGAPYSTKAELADLGKLEVELEVEQLTSSIEVSEPTAVELVAIYRSLNTEQREIFHDLMDAVETRESEDDDNYN